MANEERKYQGDKLPQYGKKGHKPRKAENRPQISVDDITTNDISYWNKTSGYNNVTKFNWDLIVGNPQDPTQFINPTSASVSQKLNPAQVMSVRFIPGPGWASTVKDGVNRSLARFMAIMRSHLSSSQIGFETADLGIFFASTSSITANIGLAKRVLECTKLWEDRNQAYPRGLVMAQGFVWEDVAFNINQYIPRLNSLIDMYNAMNVLDIFDVYDRQYSMTHNVFIDEDSELGQMYIFMPEGYYVYDDTPDEQNPYNMAVWHNHREYADFGEFLDVIEHQIYSWYNSSDLYQINGVIKRAFKDVPAQRIPYYSSEVVKPVVDRAFLMQIMNATLLGPIENFAGLNIKQDPTTQNYVIWKPAVKTTHRFVLDAPAQILRVFEDDISQDDNMEMTRLLTFGYYDAQNDIYSLKNCGSELVTTIEMFAYDVMENDLVRSAITKNYVNVDPTIGSAGSLMAIRELRSIQPFRYIPAVHLLHTLSEGVIEYEGLIGDMYNWMSFERLDYESLQTQALQSLWIPKNGI